MKKFTIITVAVLVLIASTIVILRNRGNSPVQSKVLLYVNNKAAEDED